MRSMAHKPALAGMAIWVMGIEDPGFGPVIGGLLSAASRGGLG
jgi:hypothetical protein